MDDKQIRLEVLKLAMSQTVGYTSIEALAIKLYSWIIGGSTASSGQPEDKTSPDPIKRVNGRFAKKS